MEFNKGDIVYIRCAVAKMHVTGVKFQIDTLVKKDGVLVSIRGNVLARMDIEHGY